MYFASLCAALQMDGHGGYVWFAYIIAVGVLAIVIILPRRRAKAFVRQLQGTLKRQHRDTH